MAVYPNGTDRPDEVHATGDVNELAAALRDRLSRPAHANPWDDPDYVPPPAPDWARVVDIG